MLPKNVKLRPEGGTDAWKDTYYTPRLNVNNVERTLVAVSASCSLTGRLDLAPTRQFDQGGFFVEVDEDTWIKAGLEYVDGVLRLSCVVTSDGASDWSSSPWPHGPVLLRISHILPKWEGQAPSFVFEASPPSDPPVWSMARICALRGTWKIGVFAASPLDGPSDCTATFHDLEMSPLRPLSHNDEPRPE